MRIGIICPSEIAFRRFLPALQKIEEIEYVGVAYATLTEWYGKDTEIKPGMEKVLEVEKEKADKFVEAYGGKVFSGYEAMLSSGEIDAVYLPLPPALHYAWAKLALEKGLHVLVEKPSTTKLSDTEELVRLAIEKGLALHENYMFAYHTQLDTVREVQSQETAKNIWDKLQEKATHSTLTWDGDICYFDEEYVSLRDVEKVLKQFGVEVE